MRAIRNAVGVALLMLVSVAVSLAAGELAIRALDAWRGLPSALDEVEKLANDAGVSPDALNVYYLGESTMEGVPWNPRLSIPQLLDRLFGGVVAGRPLRAVNLARSGRDLAFNVERLDLVLADPERFHPGLVVVYVGHNEFLDFEHPIPVGPKNASWWRRWLGPSLLVERIDRRLSLQTPLDVDERALFDVPMTSEATSERVFERYEELLAHVIDASAAQGVPVVLSTAASNVSDFEPSRSVYCGPAERRAEFADLFDRATAARDAGRDDEAIALLETARGICDRFAELEFQLGRLLERRGDRAGAQRAYQAALDADARPLRAGTRINDTIRRLGAARDVPVADAVARLAEISARPAPGYDFFVDAHHPTAAGYAWIARDVAEAIRTRFGVTEPLRPLDPAAVAGDFDLDDPAFLGPKLVERGRWFSRVSTLRFDGADRLAHAERAFEQAAALAPDAADPQLGFAVVAYLRRDPAAGDLAVERARARDAATTDAYLAKPWVRAVVARARAAPAAR